METSPSTNPSTHALVPGTFDPPTLAHLDLIQRASVLFARVTVGVAGHPTKDALFTVEERLGLLRDALGEAGADAVGVQAIEGLVVDACREVGANVLVRGVRGGSEFDYEAHMARTNRQMHPDVDTVLLFPDPAHAHVSSTLVRQIARMGGDVDSFVPPVVAAALRGRFDG